VGFAITAQISAPWSLYDPLVAHPAAGALPTLLGFAYLSSAIGALAPGSSRGRVATACALGVLGFLTYEITIVFVASLGAVAAIAWFRGRGKVAVPWSRLAWIVGVPLAVFVASRAIVAGNPVSGYAGTTFSADPAIGATWMVAAATSEPTALWGVASEYVDLARTGVLAIGGALLIAALLTAWAMWARSWTVDVDVSTRTNGPTEPDLRAGPLIGLGIVGTLAPLPFIVTPQWGAALRTFGTTYMHSLIPLWCWAGVMALVAWAVVRRAPSWRVLTISAVAVFLVVGTQLSINHQIAGYMVQHPLLGIDVTGALDGTTASHSDRERCASLATMRQHPDADTWIRVLNREFEQRHGVPYCGADES
jgi:hypothetical protein